MVSVLFVFRILLLHFYSFECLSLFSRTDSEDSHLSILFSQRDRNRESYARILNCFVSWATSINNEKEKCCDRRKKKRGFTLAAIFRILSFAGVVQTTEWSSKCRRTNVCNAQICACTRTQ